MIYVSNLSILPIYKSNDSDSTKNPSTCRYSNNFVFLPRSWYLWVAIVWVVRSLLATLSTASSQDCKLSLPEGSTQVTWDAGHTWPWTSQRADCPLRMPRGDTWQTETPGGGRRYCRGLSGISGLEGSDRCCRVGLGGDRMATSDNDILISQSSWFAMTLVPIYWQRPDVCTLGYK